MFFKKLELYTTIEDLPIGNFQRIMKEGDLKYMIYKGKFKKKHLPKLEKAWIDCYNQYLQTFGLNKMYLLVLEQEEKIAKLICDRWIKDLKHLNGVIKHEEQVLKQMILPTKGVKKSFEEDLAIIQKHNGFVIDPKKTSVKMFFTYVKMLEKEANDQKVRNATKD
ncbi:MAG: hypothetical protein OEM04_01480 [Flavobacteriaceae bacterium]|jgi:hypothetical protein|nr:hypothetical protein [Flavobacteriaceae bacterium]